MSIIEWLRENASRYDNRTEWISDCVLALGVARKSVLRKAGEVWPYGEEKISSVMGGEPSTEDFRVVGKNTLLNLLKQNEDRMEVTQILDKLDCSPAELEGLIEECRMDGVDIFRHGDKVIHSSDTVSQGETFTDPLSDAREIVYAIASDTHFGSKAVQITALKEFCEQARKQGVKDIFLPGDALAGAKVYTGQEQDLYAHGATEQENSLLANLPIGFNWWVMAGNHDYDFMKRSGHNAILALSKKREDIHYIGGDDVTIPLLKGVDLKLWHPSGGIPYSYSYRLQKGVEQLAFQELYRVILDKALSTPSQVRFFHAGHLHIQLQALFGTILGTQSGAFEGRTNYLKRKGYYPAVGGYIIKTTLKKGNILRFETPFLTYPDIEDDYKNYNHDWKEEEIVESPILGG